MFMRLTENVDDSQLMETILTNLSPVEIATGWSLSLLAAFGSGTGSNADQRP